MGATHGRLCTYARDLVSIHAPVMGATAGPSWRPAASSGFNPRARDGRDPHALGLLAGCDLVSIHAPVMGATALANNTGTARLVSIHAPVMGATRHRCRARSPVSGFNPRARDGRDRSLGVSTLGACSFNPRARDGRDDGSGAGWRPILCFNPRARDGRDLLQKLCPGLVRRFNPRARDGRDPQDGAHGGQPHGVSIHAPVMGATGSGCRCSP